MRDALSQGRAPVHGGLALLVGIVVALQLTGPEPGLLYLAPALVLLAALVANRYPGERLLQAVARAWRPPQRRRRRAPARALVSPRSRPRGGVLLALALAGRGPPPRRRHRFAVALA